MAAAQPQSGAAVCLNTTNTLKNVNNFKVPVEKRGDGRRSPAEIHGFFRVLAKKGLNRGALCLFSQNHPISREVQ
jgi:hypothetical protein